MGSYNKTNAQQRRKYRVRSKVRASDRARLSVHKTGRHIYAQVIDDIKGMTIAAASSQDPKLRKSLKSTSTIEAGAAVGKQVAEKAIKQGTKKVVFDRGSFLYHGRIKALADAAREAGMEF